MHILLLQIVTQLTWKTKTATTRNKQADKQTIIKRAQKKQKSKKKKDRKNVIAINLRQFDTILIQFVIHLRQFDTILTQFVINLRQICQKSRFQQSAQRTINNRVTETLRSTLIERLINFLVFREFRRKQMSEVNQSDVERQSIVLLKRPLSIPADNFLRHI